MTRSVVWGAYAAHTSMVIALTMLKVFFRIGYLWFTERQRIRTIEYIPVRYVHVNLSEEWKQT